jgi:hypothetical protein
MLTVRVRVSGLNEMGMEDDVAGTVPEPFARQSQLSGLRERSGEPRLSVHVPLVRLFRNNASHTYLAMRKPIRTEKAPN